MTKSDTSKSCCCPVYRSIETLTKKWTIHILRTMSERKHMRFTDIKEALPDINSRMLSERLSDLEEQGMLDRSVQNTKPITIEYTITEKGKDFDAVLDAICTWACKWKDK